jgi:hypothetical protein
MLHPAEQAALCGLAPSVELDDEWATGGELRFVGAAPYYGRSAGWFRHHMVSLGAARSAGHNHAVRIR